MLSYKPESAYFVCAEALDAFLLVLAQLHGH